jgi:hypothetical protein
MTDNEQTIEQRVAALEEKLTKLSEQLSLLVDYLRTDTRGV